MKFKEMLLLKLSWVSKWTSLSEEQQLLKDSITTFVDKDYLFDIRQKNIKTDLGYSSDFWKTFADLGWLGMPFSESDGGFNGGPIDLMVIMESLEEVWWLSLISQMLF